MTTAAVPACAIAAASLLALAGCRGPTREREIAVVVAPAAAAAAPGESLQLAATVSGSANRAVAWWVREPRGCGSVTQAGQWTAPLVPAPARCHVVATSHDGSESGSAEIEVRTPSRAPEIREAPSPGRGPRQLSISPPLSVAWSVAEVESDPAHTTPAFPLRVSADRRYLEDQDGRPFRVQADAAWFMSTNAAPRDVEAYLALRQAQGFNAFYLMAMVHTGNYKGIPNAPGNRAGAPPFTVPGSFATPHEPYWAWIDSIIDRAAERGMVVMLAYTYLGYEGGAQGWYREVLQQPSPEACFEWGRWLGNRYKSKANLIWLGLGDYHPPTGSEGSLRVRRILEGIKRAGASQLFMAEMSSPDTLPSDVPDFADLIDQNSFYGYGPGGNGLVYETADRAWAVTPPRPAWQQEGIYEFDPNVPAFTGASWETRRARFWSVLAGGTAGDGFGSRGTYQWVGFPANLFSQGASHSTVAYRLFASLPWWKLRPSGTAPGYAGVNLVTAGGGTRGASDYVTAALVEGGTGMLAYLPPTGRAARSITIDLSAMAAPPRARWYDPATGAWTPIAPGLARSAQATFETPGANGAGANDWVLVLDTPGALPASRCGTLTPRGLYTPPRQAAGVECLVTARSTSDSSVVARLLFRF